MARAVHVHELFIRVLWWPPLDKGKPTYLHRREVTHGETDALALLRRLQTIPEGWCPAKAQL